MTSIDNITVAVDANTDEFCEAMERATEAVEEFRKACERLEEPPIRVTVESRGDASYTEIEPADS